MGVWRHKDKNAKWCMEESLKERSSKEGKRKKRQTETQLKPVGTSCTSET